MIPLSVTQALIIYSVIVGGLVLGIWLYTEISVRRPQRSLGKQFIWHCNICGFTYLDDEAQGVHERGDRGVRKPVPPEQHKPEDRSGGSKRKRPHARRRGPRRRR